MNFFILDKINIILKINQLKIVFCDEKKVDNISLSTKKYVEIMKGNINKCYFQWDNLKKITNHEKHQEPHEKLEIFFKPWFLKAI